MANVSYPWNPYQDQLLANIKEEPIAVKGGDKVVFIPRAAPFFTRNFSLKVKSSGRPLIMGKDYVFAHPFRDFINTYNRNCFGMVSLRNQPTDIELLITYSTIGGPFVLDEVAYALQVANILNNPRSADWSQIVNLPSEFPPAPHDHPISDSYRYEDMVVRFEAMVAALEDTVGNPTVLSALEAHIKEGLKKAHTAVPDDIGLGNVKNYTYATASDFPGNSNNKLLTLDMVKELIRQMMAGTIK